VPTEPVDESPAPEVDAGALDGAGSILDRVKQHRKELLDDTTITFLVPGYHGDLAVRYRAIPSEEVEKVVKNIGQKAKPNLVVACDFLIRCCEAMLIRREDAGDAATMSERFEQLGGSDPVRLGRRIAEVMGYDANTSQEAVLGLFSPNRNRDLAVGEHALSLINWMQGKEGEIDEGLLGE
jgi:hypothetical protein